MNLGFLQEQYFKSPRLAQVATGISFSEPKAFFLKNLQGSSVEFVISSFYHYSENNFNYLIVLTNAEEAAYVYNTLESLTQALDIFYFPSSFKHKKDFRSFNNSHVMLRTEALTKIAAGGNKKIIVTYPEALLEKVVPPSTLSGNIIHIKTHEIIQPEQLFKLFVKYGFKRTDFVYEPGQFAVRGGIIDIYSFGNEKPYRIELFDNEVESIRLMSPETQLSERKLLQVSIIPNVETQFQQEEKVSFFQFLPDSTLVWIKDWHVVKEKLNEQETELIHYFQSATSLVENKTEEETNGAAVLQQNDFISVINIENYLTTKPVLEFGFQPSFPTQQIIEFHTQPQPAFNRQFPLLIQNLESFQKQGYALFICAEQSKQLERLHSIFTDLNASIQFTPVIANVHEGFIEHDLKIVCYTDHQIFQRYHKYRIKQAYDKNKALTLKALQELQPGDYVTHIDYGVGVYSGLQKIEVNGKLQEAVRLIYKDNDILYVNIQSLHKISKFTGKEGTLPKINKLGSDAWNKLKEKTKAKVKEIAFDLIQLYATRKAQKGFSFSPDTYMQTELEASFIYEDTPDQSKATVDVKKDMESPAPMDRLICGDVGFGKTEIAIRAAFKACADNKQVAVLVPTTILAFQHHKTFSDRLKDFPVTIEYVNRFRTAKEKKEIFHRLAEGKIDIIIGTHSLLGKEVKFKDLGLLIIDEEQKFGVAHKEKLKTLRTSVDCLTLTATPIPRTLQFSLMGARDLSIINTPPPNRQPIQTEIRVFNEDFIREAIYYETEREGQVFFIHNRVQGLPEMAGLIQSLCPDLNIAYAHGQMEGKTLEQKILDFIDGKYDVLVCTNIIESGVDISNVNTIIVNNAHQFGLSDLHQLRGRVGRNNKKAFCYLLAPPLSTLPDDSRKRLQTLEQFSDLGSGFQIAMRDLDIRGAGNLLGGEQSGFIAEIGFEMYQKILDESIRELKRSSFKELFKEEISKQDDYVSDCTIDTDLEILIPDAYVENTTERLLLYTRLNQCNTEQELQQFHKEITDRFGTPPQVVEDLFITVRCRWMAVELGFEKMNLKDSVLRCYFISQPDSPYFESNVFQQILHYVQHATNKVQVKQAGKHFLLIVQGMNNMVSIERFLQRMHEAVFQRALVQS